ncbi:methyltransferase domain-containing protein [Alicyclobacillus fodiniaquatilis]|uniref:Methyltransferase domain-containing protein n=1 Tax=Alicyclobacillus fodiniaquatilis TaxID=1661150 RepID=A0ABW4JDY3_9BACL
MDSFADVKELDAKELLEQMLAQDIVIAPWLSVGEDIQRMTAEQRKILQDAANEMSRMGTDDDLQVPPFQFFITRGFARRAYEEILLSTAIYLSHMRLGALVVTSEMILVAQRLVRDFLQTHGLNSLIRVYAIIISFENCQALAHYQRIPLDIFISGKWHRPWIEYSLEYELEHCCAVGLFRCVSDETDTYVELTSAGYVVFEQVQSILHATDYLRKRSQLIRISQFTYLDDYDTIFNALAPTAHEIRRDLIALSQIQPDMKVLELGCGTGALTLEDGLYKAVGEHGQVIATDPSPGMLSRAASKGRIFQATNVEFIQASAEHLPFADNTFDAVIGSVFLHYTHIQEALREIHRVAKPGAIFATLYPLRFSTQQGFFVEWFKPLLTHPAFKNNESSQLLPDETTVPPLLEGLFQQAEVTTRLHPSYYGDVKKVVKFFIQVGNVFENVLLTLPWQAQHDLIDSLIERGQVIADRYGRDELIYQQPSQWIKAVVHKG